MKKRRPGPPASSEELANFFSGLDDSYSGVDPLGNVVPLRSPAGPGAAMPDGRPGRVFQPDSESLARLKFHLAELRTRPEHRQVAEAIFADMTAGTALDAVTPRLVGLPADVAERVQRALGRAESMKDRLQECLDIEQKFSEQNPGIPGFANVNVETSLTERLADAGVRFRPLGFFGGEIYVQSAPTRDALPAILKCGIGSIGTAKAYLARICPEYEFWENTYYNEKVKKDKDGEEEVSRTVNWDKAVWALNKCTMHSFDPEEILGAGVWRKNGSTIISDGEAAFEVENGKLVPVDFLALDSKIVISPSLPKMKGLADLVPLTTAEGAEFRERLETAPNWRRPGDGTLFAGWLASATVCGALRWRSHAHLVGQSGSGKSTLVDLVAKPVIESVGGLVEAGGTTEPAIRRRLGRDALPVVLDEAESDTRADAQRLTAIMQSARVASSGGRTTKGQGGQNGGGFQSFATRYQLFMSSVAPFAEGQANESRITELTLNKVDMNTRTDAQCSIWDDFLDYCNKTITPDFGARLMLRIAGKLDVLEAAEDALRDAIRHAGATARFGDQTATLLAAAWVLDHDVVPDAAEVLMMLDQVGVEKQVAERQAEGDADQGEVVGIIGQSTIDVVGKGAGMKMSISEAVGLALGQLEYMQSNDLIDAESARIALSRIGVIARDEHVFISKKSQDLAAIFARHPSGRWSGHRWVKILAQHPESQDGGQQRFGGSKAYSVRLPLGVFWTAK